MDILLLILDVGGVRSLCILPTSTVISKSLGFATLSLRKLSLRNVADDWMTRYFFNRGTMLFANLLLYFQDDVAVPNHWLVNGKHYAQTSEEWLKRMECHLSSTKPIMESTYGKDSAVKWTTYWRILLIAGAEMFRYNDGEEWMIAHFLFKKK